MGATIATLQNTLKDDYLPPMNEQLNNTVLIVQRVESSTKEIFGNQAVVPLHTNRTSGVGARAENATLPGAGTLQNNGVNVTTGQFVSLADINGGKLRFTPAANANGNAYASFTFQVQDDGGTLNGGIDLDPGTKTITFNIAAVNSAPQGTSKTVSTNEDAAYPFVVGDFGPQLPAFLPVVVVLVSLGRVDLDPLKDLELPV